MRGLPLSALLALVGLLGLANGGLSQFAAGTSRSFTCPDEADAASALLLSLLGVDAAANTTLARQLLPPGTDPCQPAGTAQGSVSAVVSQPNLGGSCGPQPASLLANASGAGYVQQSLPVCEWRWLSCSNWHIVAVNLSAYCSTSSSSSSAPSGCAAAPLRGSLPASAPNVSHLASLDLSGNTGLTGSLLLAAWPAPWASLKLLNMSGCGLDGSLPGNWSALPSLEVLDLSRNPLTGALPSGMGALSQLRELRLSGDSGLTGFIPSSWAALTSLQTLDVRDACGICGNSSVLPKTASALVSGSHVDQTCNLDVCITGSSGGSKAGATQDVFQGVMAGFTSVLGVIALLLIVRRVRYCVSGRTPPEEVRAAHPLRSDGSLEVGGGAAAAGGSSRGGRGARPPRAQRQRVYTGPPVPLYMLEFEPDGKPKWSVDIVISQAPPAPTAAAPAASLAVSPDAPAQVERQGQPSPSQQTDLPQNQQSTPERSDGVQAPAAPLALPPTPAPAAARLSEEHGTDANGATAAPSAPATAPTSSAETAAAGTSAASATAVPGAVIVDMAGAAPAPGQTDPEERVVRGRSLFAHIGAVLAVLAPPEWPTHTPPIMHVFSADPGLTGQARGAGAGAAPATSDAAPTPPAVAVVASRGEPMWKAALKIARPPDAIVLMPGSWEFCVGRRVEPPADAAAADGGSTPRVAGCPCCRSEEAEEEAPAAFAAAATTSGADAASTGDAAEVAPPGAATVPEAATSDAATAAEAVGASAVPVVVVAAPTSEVRESDLGYIHDTRWSESSSGMSATTTASTAERRLSSVGGSSISSSVGRAAGGGGEPRAESC